MSAVELPAGHRLYRATRDRDLALSPMGESGPGLYTTDDPATAQKYLRAKQSISRDNPNGPPAALVHLTTTQPLRMVDRSTDEGEALHRELQRDPTTMKILQGEEGIARYREAGFHGVVYPGVGKDSREVVVHDLSHLAVEQFEEHL